MILDFKQGSLWANVVNVTVQFSGFGKAVFKCAHFYAQRFRPVMVTAAV